MREVLFNCFGAVNVEENDNGEFVKLSDFEKLAEKCSRYIDDYEAERIKCLEQKEKIERLQNNLDLQRDKRYGEEIENKKLKYDIDSLKKQLQSSKDKQIELLNRCDELEKQLETMESLPVEPIEVAKLLINSEYEYETSEIQRRLLNKGDTEICERYTIDELEQIAEHLLIYCKHNKGCEE